MAHVPTALDLSRREVAWRDAITEAEANAVLGLRQTAELLGLHGDARLALVGAGLEIARTFAAEYTYANYEHRTGMPWPDEGRVLDGEERRAAWRMALERLEGVARRTS